MKGKALAKHQLHTCECQLHVRELEASFDCRENPAWSMMRCLSCSDKNQIMSSSLHPQKPRHSWLEKEEKGDAVGGGG